MPENGNGGKRWARLSAQAAVGSLILAAVVLGGTGLRAATKVEVRLEDHLEQTREIQALPRLARIEALIESMDSRLERIEGKIDRQAERED